MLQTDRGGEFTAVEFATYCAEEGVERHLTAPYSPKQNGMVERRNQSIVGMARCMLKAKGMPTAFWGEAMSTAVFILNRAPTKALNGRTPFEAWHGRKPSVAFMRTFGCMGHVKNTKPSLTKLEDRSTKMVFLGYEKGSKAYRLCDPVTGRVTVSRDVVFDEAGAWTRGRGGGMRKTWPKRRARSGSAGPSSSSNWSSPVKSTRQQESWRKQLPMEQGRQGARRQQQGKLSRPVPPRRAALRLTLPWDRSRGLRRRLKSSMLLHRQTSPVRGRLPRRRGGTIPPCGQCSR